MCATFCFSISSRCDDIFAEVKGGNFMPPPPAAGAWRGGPAAAGLKQSTLLKSIRLTPTLLSTLLISIKVEVNLNWNSQPVQIAYWRFGPGWHSYINTYYIHSVHSLGSHPPFIGSHKVTYIGIYIQCIHSHTYLHSHRCIHTFTYIVRHSFVITLSRVSTYALPCSLNTLSHLTITSAGISRSPDPRTHSPFSHTQTFLR